MMSRIRPVEYGKLIASTRVAGGIIADFKAHPSLVRMLLPRKALNGTYIFGIGQCGGTIITSSWIVTAAHCCARDTSAEPWDSQYVQFQVGAFYDKSCNYSGTGTMLQTLKTINTDFG